MTTTWKKNFFEERKSGFLTSHQHALTRAVKKSNFYNKNRNAFVVPFATTQQQEQVSGMTPEEIASQPRWELERHFKYESPNDSQIDREMAAIETQCKEFKAKYEGKLSVENGAMLLEAIETFEEIDIQLTRALSYVSLASDTRLEDAKMQQRKASLMQRYGSFQGNF